MNCANCGALLPEGSTVCFECGAPQKITTPPQNPVNPEMPSVNAQTVNSTVSGSTTSDSGLKCKNCGAALAPGATVCFECGVAQSASSTAYTNNNIGGATSNTGANMDAPPPTNNVADAVNQNVKKIATAVSSAPKSKMIAGLLALFLGSFGLDQFYLGYIKWGLLRLALTVVSAGVVSTLWGFYDCYRIFTGIIKTDANGNHLT